MPAPELLEVNGVTLSIHGWARRAGLDHQTVRSRLKSGWDPERAVSTPRSAKRAAKDLTGQAFGSWTVIGEGACPRPLCVCRCGVQRHVIRSTLTNGSSKQCRGCLERGQRARQAAAAGRLGTRAQSEARQQQRQRQQRDDSDLFVFLGEP